MNFDYIFKRRSDWQHLAKHMGVLNTQDRVKRDELLSTVVGDQDAGET